MRISTFAPLKNEVEYVGFHIMSLLDAVDEMVFADGNSTDGTIGLIEHIQRRYDGKGKIKLFANQDCKDLKEDYVRLFNHTLQRCTGDYVWFIHPDMICTNPARIRESITGALRYSYKMKSYAGENRDWVFTEGRGERWNSLFKNVLGLHYWGYYGTPEEDLYFADITGKEHIPVNQLPNPPYEIVDTAIEICHFCDTKPYDRRLDRMLKILKHTFKGLDESDYRKLAESHPRVTLKDGEWNGMPFRFRKTNFLPDVFEKYGREFGRFNLKKENESLWKKALCVMGL